MQRKLGKYKKYLVFSLFFCLLFPWIANINFVNAAPTGWHISESWKYRVAFNVNSSKIDEVLTDFPVYVKLEDAFSWNVVNDDLSDLFFVDSQNNTLPYEIESFTLNFDAHIWVKLESVSNVVDTIFYMYFGNPISTSHENVEAVWSSDFKMVLHMNDATTSTIIDSTSYGNNGTKLAANEPIEAAGQIGKAQTFDGADDKINVGHGASLDITSAITISAYIKPDGHQGAITRLVEKLWSSSWAFMLNDDDKLYFQGNFAVGGIATRTSTSTFTIDTYNLVTVTYDSTTLKFYINGVAAGINDASPTGALGSDAAQDVNIGILPGVGFPYKGDIDNIEISNIDRSSAWVGASYLSQSNTLLFMSNIEEPQPSALRGEMLAAILIGGLIFIPALLIMLFLVRRR